MWAHPSAPCLSHAFPFTPIDPIQNYPTLTRISLAALAGNPLFELMYPSTVSPKGLFAYHRETKIELPDEGKTVQSIKVVDNEDGEIVKFASWYFDQQWKRRNRPLDGSDLKFANELGQQIGPKVQQQFNRENDIGMPHHLILYPTDVC